MATNLVRRVSSSTRAMSTISFAKYGAPASVLSADKSAAPKLPNVGEVQVAIKASAVTVDDIKKVRGASLSNRPAGTGGFIGYGAISRVPPGEFRHSVGDSVLVSDNGVWADEVCVSSMNVTNVDKLAPEEAANLPNFVSAWAILHNYAKLKAGDVIVQTHPNTAVGVAISAIGKALGYEVVVLGHDDDKLSDKLRDHKSIKLAVVGQSGKHVTSLSKAMAHSGTVVAYQGVYEPISATSDAAFSLSSIIFNDARVVGFDLYTFATHDRLAYQKNVEDVLKFIREKKLALKPTHVFPQAEYMKAIDVVSKTGASAVLKH